MIAIVNKGATAQRLRREGAQLRHQHTAALRKPRDWLLAEGCSAVAMESADIYW